MARWSPEGNGAGRGKKLGDKQGGEGGERRKTERAMEVEGGNEFKCLDEGKAGVEEAKKALINPRGGKGSL
eukprot:766932-Hanusia_phi.AAC.2